MALRRRSHHRLHDYFVPAYNFFHSDKFFLIKVKTEHIPFPGMIGFQITGQLDFAAFVVFFFPPYFDLNNILFPAIIND